MDIRKLRQMSLFDDFNQLGGGPVGQGNIGMDYAPIDIGNAGLAGTMGGIQPGMAAQPPPYIPSPTLDPRMQETERLKQLYNPETQAIDMFNQSLKNQPQLNDPGIARRIAASAAAFKGGPDMADRFMYAPYMKENARWKESIDPQYKAANLERQSNQGQLTLAREIMRGEDVDRKQAEVERRNRDIAAVDRERIASTAKIAEERNGLARLKMEGWQFKTDGPEVIAVRSVNGKTEIQRTGVKTGNLSDTDKILFGLVTASMLQGQRAEDAVNLKKTPPALDPNRTNDDTPSQQGTAAYNNAQREFDTNPAMQKYIKLDRNARTFELIPPKNTGTVGKFFGGKDAPDEEWNAYKDLTSRVYQGQTPNVNGMSIKVPTPSGSSGGLGPSTVPSTSAPQPQQPGVEQGYTLMEENGHTFQLRSGQVDAYIKSHPTARRK